MLRQNARLRREYLYKKATDAKDHVTAERKRKFRDAVENGKPVPTELRNDAEALQREIALDDAAHSEPSDGIDSEYFNAGVTDPKVLVTTSRDPSSKLVQSRSMVITSKSPWWCHSSLTTPRAEYPSPPGRATPSGRAAQLLGSQ